MDQMLLFDVDLITYAICGRVKDVLSQLVNRKQCPPLYSDLPKQITTLSLTMVVCGTKGGGTMKG